MRLSIEFTSIDERELITLPLHYNRLLQGLIYHFIKEEMPEIHDGGFNVGNRKLKLFVFSRIFGQVLGIKNGQITFGSSIKFKVSSPLPLFIETLGNNLLKTKIFHLGKTQVKLDSLYIEPVPDFVSCGISVKAISPLTLYSTFNTPDGKKKTYYYHPRKKEFGEQIKNNLLRKANQLGIEVDNNVPFVFQPLVVKNKDLKVLYYKNTVIKGWYGLYRMEGDPRLMTIAYSAGVGLKNAQGFGMIEKVL